MGNLKAALALVLSACPAAAQHGDFCRAVERGNVLSCAPCEAPATISGPAAQVLARDAHEALLDAERSTSFLSGPPNSGEVFYYSSDTGLKSVSGATAASMESADRSVSQQRQRVHYFQLTTAGYAGDQSAQVIVRHYMRDWVPDEGHVFDAPPHVTYYCVTRHGEEWAMKKLMDY
jgi:hypothetical protein